jgi:2-C-methyl-D-erythritol 4-phosphate cytidylyltransferase
MRNTVIITAGGIGKRMGSEIPKQFLEVNGKPVLMHTITAFYEYDKQFEILLTLPAQWEDYWLDLCKKHAFFIEHRVVVGGEERFHSVKNAINHATGELIAIHDGVRPMVSQETIQRVFESAQIHHAAVPVIAMNQSIRKVTQEGNKSLNRNDYFIVQTPQVFTRKILIESYAQTYDTHFTDDASVVESRGYSIHLVDGNEENVKITTTKDLKLVEHFLNE